MYPFRRWLFQRRLRRFLDLPLERSPGGGSIEAGWSWYLLAKAFDAGNGPARDASMTFRLYLRSAQAGLPLGQICAGLAYRTGTGTTEDPVAAQAWWQAAADQGDPGAEVNMEGLPPLPPRARAETKPAGNACSSPWLPTPSHAYATNNGTDLSQLDAIKKGSLESLQPNPQPMQWMEVCQEVSSQQMISVFPRWQVAQQHQ